MTLYKNKYRVETTRLPDYDYSGIGYYFVIICTKDKIPFFGNIKDEKVILSEIGKFAEKYWMEIPLHFQNVKIDEYIIMPNHIHGIVVFEDVDDLSNVKTQHAASKDQKNINKAQSHLERDAAC